MGGEIVKRAKLIISITYDDHLNLSQEQEVECVLKHAAEHLAANGMLSGVDEESATVDTWREEVFFGN